MAVAIQAVNTHLFMIQGNGVPVLNPLNNNVQPSLMYMLSFQVEKKNNCS